MNPPKLIADGSTKRHWENAVRACEFYEHEVIRLSAWPYRMFMPWRLRRARELRKLWRVVEYDRETMYIASGGSVDPEWDALWAAVDRADIEKDEL